MASAIFFLAASVLALASSIFFCASADLALAASIAACTLGSIGEYFSGPVNSTFGLLPFVPAGLTSKPVLVGVGFGAGLGEGVGVVLLGGVRVGLLLCGTTFGCGFGAGVGLGVGLACGLGVGVAFFSAMINLQFRSHEAGLVPDWCKFL